MSDYLLTNGVGTAVSVNDEQREGAVDLAIPSLPEATALADADTFAVHDASETAHRKTLLSTLRTWLQSAFDSVYAPTAHGHTDLHAHENKPVLDLVPEFNVYDANRILKVHHFGAQLLEWTDAILSLNGKTGAVALNAGDGIGVSSSEQTLTVTNTDRGSAAVATHESTYTHTDLHAHGNQATLDAIPDHAAVTEGYALVKGSGGGLAWAEQSGTGGGDLDTVTITFDGNDHDAGTPPAAIDQVVSHVITLPAGTGLEKDGAAFFGWNTAADGSGTRYSAGDKVTFAVATTLYAQYSSPIEATGGTVTDEGGYRYHTFTVNGTFEVTDLGSSDGEVEYLVVAGGGSGGCYQGGGGAGGLLTGTLEVSVDEYPVVVGNGGASQTTDNAPGNNGENSSALGFTAVGGGGGGGTGGNAGQSGGSGGGGVTANNPGGTGTSGQGNNGGAGGSGAGNYPGGGGGGADAAGGDATGTTTPGNGGTGKTVWGSTYAGGGGGSGTDNTSVSGDGGAGGGGKGGYNSGGWVPAESGGVNTGGGGGAAGYSTTKENSGSGGSGIVIIRYPHPGE